MKTLAILNFEPKTVNVTGIQDYRPASAASFLGRYRVLDFMISNFTNTGLNNIQIYIKDRPRSTVEHVTGTNYNINVKSGKIHILTGEKNYPDAIYNTDIAAFMANKAFIEDKKEELILIAPSHFVFIQDFNKLIDYHISSTNDITLLYQNVNNANVSFALCDTIDFDENNRIVSLKPNAGKYKNRNIYLDCAILSRKLFLQLIEKAYKISSIYWFRDILENSLVDFKVGGFAHKGYLACINTLKAYFNSQIELREKRLLDALISPAWPIYTMTNDTCPTLYENKGSASSSLIGNGCLIKGKVTNSVIGRDVIVEEGAVLDRVVLLPDSKIGKKVHLANAVVDRYAQININADLKGEIDFPLYVKRGDHI